MKHSFLIFILIAAFINSCNCQNNDNSYQKVDSDTAKTDIKTVVNDFIEAQEKAKYQKVKYIPCPENYDRIKHENYSYAEYLRNLDLKTENNIVYLYNGQKKGNQNAQFAIIKIDVGTQDLQQCADAVMRLRAEYLYSKKKYNEIHFNFLSDGKPRYYKNYINGDYSYKKYRRYMNYIFSYANTASLKNELKKVNDINDMKIGDVFIQKGNPYGHAITVMDIAINKKGEKIFMLSQSYMPAQEIHILKNPYNSKISPWFKIKEAEKLYTPEWTFEWSDLKRF